MDLGMRRGLEGSWLEDAGHPGDELSSEDLIKITYHQSLPRQVILFQGMSQRILLVLHKSWGEG